MRIVKSELITKAVAEMCNEAAYQLPCSVLNKLKQAAETEKSPLGKNVLNKIIENDMIASKGELPMCQDTGIVVCFVEIGTDVHIEGDLYNAINAGVRQGYKESYLRNSVVNHPIERINTKDNTPAVVHIEFVPGDKIHLMLAPKGGGSEGMCVTKVFPPSIGYEGVKKFVLDTVNQAGGKPCPPLILGVGIGGSMEKAAVIAKKAIFRDIDDEATNAIDRKLEQELLTEINKLGIGPMGFGGVNTALAVKVNSYPCHIVNMPVAVVFQCHASRHAERVL